MEVIAGNDHSFIDFQNRGLHPRSKSAINRISAVVCKAAAILVALLLLRILGSLAGIYLQLRSMHITCGDDQPLVRIHHNFLPEDEFQIMKDSLPNHPLLTSNSLAEDKFNGTAGWLVKFNKGSFQKFQSNPLFQIILPYLDRILIPEANAFVFNLLVCKETSDEIAVMPHFDNTVGVKMELKSPREEYLAHQVNVLYVSIPNDFKGGELDVWPFGNDDIEDGKAVVTPVENLMVTFRGDAYHKVRGFKSPSKASRISLVFEQYHIPDNLYYKTVPYCENRECHTA